jgi:hypothetical protein
VLPVLENLVVFVLISWLDRHGRHDPRLHPAQPPAIDGELSLES